MYDTILVPTDGSSGAKAAARHALTFANAFDSQVRLLIVIDERSYSSGLIDLDSTASDQRDALEERAASNLRLLEELAAEASVPFEMALEHGIPYETILEYATEHDVDLVSMGTHGRTGLQRVLIGSVTERVVRTSDVPVLTTRAAPKEHSSYEDVLIPTDGSDAASAAIDHGLAIAERYDATVHALSVVDLSSLAGSYDIDPIIELWRDDCERAVEAVADAAESRGVDVVTKVRQATPYRAITKYIENEEIDLVTMGTHGRTGLEGYLVGSVTTRTIRTSDVPILTVRSHH